MILGAFAIAFYAAFSEDKAAKAKHEALKAQKEEDNSKDKEAEAKKETKKQRSKKDE